MILRACFLFQIVALVLAAPVKADAGPFGVLRLASRIPQWPPLPAFLQLRGGGNQDEKLSHDNDEAKGDAENNGAPEGTASTRSAEVGPQSVECKGGVCKISESLRGGDQESMTLDERVHAAMRKMGLKPADDQSSSTPDGDLSFRADVEERSVDCSNGVCEMPGSSTEVDKVEVGKSEVRQDVHGMATRISESMKVDRSLAMAALGATSQIEPGKQDRKFDEEAARSMIQQELDIIAQVQEDSEEVKQLVSEGFDTFFARRALAFAEMNVDDARAILVADQMDEEAEQQAQQQEQPVETAPESSQLPEFKQVNVASDFDPAPVAPVAPANQQATGGGAAASNNNIPKPARKSDVVFDATAAQVQELVLESPVPVLLDVYADWCGPCKVLGPILEEMAVKGGGAFRLVKVNSDNEKGVSGTLEVTALPTVFAVRDGKVLNMFQGMPRSEEMMKSFMMGLLVPGMDFDPPLTAEDKSKYEAMSIKLAKMAGAACFSFSARERLQERISAQLNKLSEQTRDYVDSEESAKIIRSLLSNVIKDPYEKKYRTVNLENKVVKAKVSQVPACLAILRGVGFVSDASGTTMTVGRNKKIVNVAPLTVARDAIDLWIDRSHREVAAAARKRKDEMDRARLQAEAAQRPDVEEEEDDEEEEVDPNACVIKLRMDGKKKVHEVVLQAEEPLSTLLEKLPAPVSHEDDVQITCVAKRLVVKSSDENAMAKSFRELGLSPSASVVVSLGNGAAAPAAAQGKPKLAERAAQKKKKGGSHTMQSVGIYGKDDNNKAELIDGGGGVWYEHDVSDDEKEEAQEVSPAEDEEPEESVEALDKQDATND